MGPLLEVAGRSLPIRKPRPFPKVATARKLNLPIFEQFIDYYISTCHVTEGKTVFRHNTMRTFRIIRACPRARPLIFRRVTKCNFNLNRQEYFEIFMTMVKANGESVNMRLVPLPVDILSFKDATLDIELPTDFMHVSKNKKYKYLDEYEAQMNFALHHLMHSSTKIRSITCGMYTFQANHKVICQSRAKKLTIFVDEMKKFPGLDQLGVYRRIEELCLLVDIEDIMTYENLFKRIFQSMKGLKSVDIALDMVCGAHAERKNMDFMINFCRVIPYLKFQVKTERKIDPKCFAGFTATVVASGARYYLRGNTTIITHQPKLIAPPEPSIAYPVPLR